MGHHSEEPFDGDPEIFRAFQQQKQEMDATQKRQRLMRELLDTTGFRGAIGAFPEGKLTPADEGAIQFAIGEQNGKVVVDFGTPVAWIGLSAQQAADLAADLLRWARLVGRKQGETVTMTIGGSAQSDLMMKTKIGK